MAPRAVRTFLSSDNGVEKTSLLSQSMDNTFQLHAPTIGSVRVRREMMARKKPKEILPGWP
jgi:hypothetical protein